jgi:hypothetical protein
MRRRPNLRTVPIMGFLLALLLTTPQLAHYNKAQEPDQELDLADPVHDLQLTDDGEVFLAAGTGLRLWNHTTGHSNLLDHDHQASITSLDIQPGGASFASGSLDHTLILSDWVRYTSFPGLHQSGILDLAFEPSTGNLLASASQDGTVAILDTTQHQMVQQLLVGDWVHAVAWSSDGTKLAAVGPGVHVWNTSSWEKIELDPGAGEGYTTEVAFTEIEEKGYLVAARGKQICFWDLDHSTDWPLPPDKTLTNPEQAISIAFDPSGTKLGVGTYDGFDVWNLLTWQQIGTGAGGRVVRTMAWSTDGYTIYTGGTGLATWDDVYYTTNAPPEVVILSPRDGTEFNITATFSGVVIDEGIDCQVTVQIDGGAWEPVEGSEVWSYSFTTEEIGEGEHLFEVRAHDGHYFSEIQSLEFTVTELASWIHVPEAHHQIQVYPAYQLVSPHRQEAFPGHWHYFRLHPGEYLLTDITLTNLGGSAEQIVVQPRVRDTDIVIEPTTESLPFGGNITTRVVWNMLSSLGPGYYHITLDLSWINGTSLYQLVSTVEVWSEDEDDGDVTLGGVRSTPSGILPFALFLVLMIMIVFALSFRNRGGSRPGQGRRR